MDLKGERIKYNLSIATKNDQQIKHQVKKLLQHFYIV